MIVLANLPLKVILVMLLFVKKIFVKCLCIEFLIDLYFKHFWVAFVLKPRVAAHVYNKKVTDSEDLSSMQVSLLAHCTLH